MNIAKWTTGVAARVSVALFLLHASVHAAETCTNAAPAIRVDPDGTLHIPPLEVPMSSFMSPQMRNALLEIMKHPYPVHPPFDAPLAEWEKYWKTYDEQVMRPILTRLERHYPTRVEAAEYGGVRVDIVTPEGGIPPENARRVMINLHGGGFYTGAGLGGLVESIPMASLGKVKVVTVDYRQAPQHRFPAASEDVARVYRELLKEYPPQNIGIYGCSAGGALTAQATAWIDKEKLPRPGALGIFCSSAGGGLGDSDLLGPILSYAILPSPQRERVSRKEGYFSGADPEDPLVSPVVSLEVLARFPPTLLVTGTRAQELSAAVYTHARLLKAGVDARIYIAEGGWHGFFVDPDIPEARDAYEYIVKWFDQQLGR